MKCVEILEARSVDGKTYGRIVRVSDEEAEKLVNDNLHKGLRRYVPKNVYKKFKKG